MGTSQAAIINATKKRGYRFWLGGLTLLLGLPLLFYYGYCWGFWGRNSLLLQYLFQCNCPVASEEARYPEQVDVVVPACRYLNIRVLPSGHLLYVRERKFSSIVTYFLDLQTDKKISEVVPEHSLYFLTDNLIYVSAGEGYILDWTNEKQYPIRKFASLHPEASVNGNLNLALLAPALHRAKYIFLINDNDTVVALGSDFPASLENSFLTGWFDIQGQASHRLEQFLDENKITYQPIPNSFPNKALSPDGRFMALQDGIYLVENNQKIVDAYPSRLRGWTYDSHAVIYSSDGPCLIQTNFGILDEPICFFQVHQPALKLKVPEKYLSPAQNP